ncbi:pirin-like C-terminal cupin domain-containing protein [Dyadobacter alkalitolerans]|uniref:pirin-like C-terminal cupin domain-containing protein n=1 Tax=Dyadobacter alkalitolerans TaxID=492736 RepID=UPI001B7FC613|nr:pirin-like C-terminal cupin domain-containing protein [Dyadobacter alkalitolerans]
MPYKKLPNGKGSIKVIVGSFEDINSVIPSYSKQFLFHIHLEPGAVFDIDIADKLEVAAFLPERLGIINNEKFNAGDFVEFDRNEGSIEIENTNTEAIDILLFGGETYQEPIFAEGPFVMNSKLDIANAYRDYFNGRYGKIDYDKQRLAPWKV